MSKFTVTYERSAYELKTIVVEADTEEEAEDLANEELERADGVAPDPAIQSNTNELYDDDESVWELMDVESSE